MIEKDEMDGGTTTVDGRPMRIVLDFNGVYKRTEEMKAPARATPSALDKASEEARKSQPVAPDVAAHTPAGGVAKTDKKDTGFKAGV